VQRRVKVIQQRHACNLRQGAVIGCGGFSPLVCFSRVL
jgi:hypothetical protein